MNDLAREKLTKLVFLHGDALLNDPRQCETLLRQECPSLRRETAALVAAQDAGVVRRLQAQGIEPLTGELAAELARALQAESPMTDEAAFWAVETWAGALGHEDRVAYSRYYSRAAGTLQRSRLGRFIRSFGWSFIGGPLSAVGILFIGWVFLPGLILLVGALIDLGMAGFSSESITRVSETLSQLWQALRSGTADDRDVLLSGPARQGVMFWMFAIGGVMSVLLITPALAWRAIWSGPARSIGGTLVLLPYLAGLGAGVGAVAGGLVAGREGSETGAVVGGGLLGIVVILAGLLGWLRSLIRASRREI